MLRPWLLWVLPFRVVAWAARRFEPVRVDGRRAWSVTPTLMLVESPTAKEPPVPDTTTSEGSPE